MKVDDPPERAEREAELPLGNEPPDEKSAPKEIDADFPESESLDEEASEKERKTERWHEFKTP